MSLLDQDVEQIQTASGYRFSATSVADLGAAEYTLVTICQDASGSVQPFGAQLETCLKTILQACQKSPRKDNLMLRLAQFSQSLTELHGFKLLSAVKPSDYDGILRLGGNTALFRSAHESIEATVAYAKQLKSQDILANAIIFIITDGEDNQGGVQPEDIKKLVENTKKQEELESLTVVLVGVTNSNVGLSTYLEHLKNGAGISQYVDIGEAKVGRLAKLAEFVSQSISSTSQALGSGGPSQPVNIKF